MTFSDLFNGRKPVIAMLHLKTGEDGSALTLAKKEIEILYNNGVDAVLVENYFGSVDDCEVVLRFLQNNYNGKVYGVNILGDYKKAFYLADKYGAKFIQIDSVCGHLNGGKDDEYANELKKLRSNSTAFVLGGVRFKYQPVNSGRSLEEDLKMGMERCDAIVVTGEGTGKETPTQKLEQFRDLAGEFPLITGAGVTIDNIFDSLILSDGIIIGSWLKKNHTAQNDVAVENVVNITSAAMYINGILFENAGRLDDAFDCYKKNADMGNAQAKRCIANLYFHKKYRSVPVLPIEKAMKNLLTANPTVVMPWDETTYEADYKETFKWHLAAAEGGNAESMSDAGVMLYTGTGCKKNIDEAKKWLGKAVSEGVEYAIKAYKDFFGEIKIEHISDEQYLVLLKEFENTAIKGDAHGCQQLHKKLILGTERQLAKFGYILSKGKYKYGGVFSDFACPCRPSGEPYAPVYMYTRIGYYFSVLKINLECFEEENPTFTFSSDITQDIIPIFNIETTERWINYRSGKYEWLDDEKQGIVLKINKSLIEKSKKLNTWPYNASDWPYIEVLERLEHNANEAVFIETGEKEYCVEICHLTPNDELVVIARYTI